MSAQRDQQQRQHGQPCAQREGHRRGRGGGGPQAQQHQAEGCIRPGRRLQSMQAEQQVGQQKRWSGVGPDDPGRLRSQRYQGQRMGRHAAATTRALAARLQRGAGGHQRQRPGPRQLQGTGPGSPTRETRRDQGATGGHARQAWRCAAGQQAEQGHLAQARQTTRQTQAPQQGPVEHCAEQRQRQTAQHGRGDQQVERGVGRRRRGEKLREAAAKQQARHQERQHPGAQSPQRDQTQSGQQHGYEEVGRRHGRGGLGQAQQRRQGVTCHAPRDQQAPAQTRQTGLGDPSHAPPSAAIPDSSRAGGRHGWRR